MPELEQPTTPAPATLDPNMMPDAAFEAVKSLTRDRSRGGNPHPSMLLNRYVSGSQTVKMKCVDLAALIAGAPDEGDAHWGENGNALADINLVNVRYGENEAAVPIEQTSTEEGDRDWLFIIHADGIVVTDADGRTMHPNQANGAHRLAGEVARSHDPFWLGVIEHKAPVFPYDEDSFDIARRQGLAFMGAALRCHEAGARFLPPAGYLAKSDPRNAPMPLPEDLRAGSITLIAAPYTEERTEKPERVTRQQAAQELDRLLGKARAAVWTATGRHPDAAARWDREHPEEYLWRTPERVPATRDEATSEVARLCAAHRLLQAPADPAKAAREKARDRVKALVSKHALPAEMSFDTGVGYKMTTKGAFSSTGAPAADAGVDASKLAKELGHDLNASA